MAEWRRILYEAPPLRIGCGYIASLTQDLLQEHGITARLVAMVTTDPWDGLTDGHTALEVWLDSKWVFLDIYWDVMFANEKGEYLSLWEVSEAVMRGLPVSLRRIDSTPDTTDEEVLREYTRRAHVPLIYDPPRWYHPREQYADLIASYPVYNGWTYMPLTEWLARFYGGPPT
jgi:hypothetical protein